MLNTLDTEKQVRIWIRKILEQDASRIHEQFDDWGGGSSGDLEKVFLDPFQNVFDAIKLSFKDLLTTAKFNWDILVTFDPKKLSEMRSNYRKRREQLDAEHKGLRDKIGEAVGGDFNMAMFMLNPAAYLGALPLAKTWKNREDITDFFKEAGFGGPSGEEKSKGLKDPTGVIGTAFGMLKKLFFLGPSEFAVLRGPLLTEQAGFSVEEELAGTLEDLGIMDDVEKFGRDTAEALEDSLVELDQTFGPAFRAINEIGESQSLEELEKALTNARQEGLDLGGASPQQLGAELQKTTDEFLADPEQREKLIRGMAEQQGKKLGEDDPLPDVNEDELKQQAADQIFQHSSTDIHEKMQESMQGLRGQLAEEFTAIAGEFGISKETEKALSQSGAGKEMIDLLGAFQQNYGLNPV
jgi:hypothetical protein